MKGSSSNSSQDRSHIYITSALSLSFLFSVILSPVTFSFLTHFFLSRLHLFSVNPTSPTSNTHPRSGLAGLRFIPVDLCQAVISQYCSVQEV